VEAVPSRPAAPRTAMAGVAEAEVRVPGAVVRLLAAGQPPPPLPPKRPPVGDRRCWHSGAAAVAADSKTATVSSA